MTREEFVAGVALLLVASCSDDRWYRLYWGEKWFYARFSLKTRQWALSKNGFADHEFDDPTQLAETLWDWGKREIPEPSCNY